MVQLQRSLRFGWNHLENLQIAVMARRKAAKFFSDVSCPPKLHQSSRVHEKVSGFCLIFIDTRSSLLLRDTSHSSSSINRSEEHFIVPLFQRNINDSEPDMLELGL
ncbi:hypothetical protein TNCT_611821 [Trichonephila clavata]|uniref:Uncharacterized protein n=1 Tax=Trichonephila clavata TaxID=2740835 RepID=A0A8X6K5R2_TRICU|nr:hypothetical protein TNCT_611821 [Trichonephila clavata]